MIPEDSVTVPRKELLRLRVRDEELAALEAAGVDNWEGYGEAMRLQNADED